MEAAASVIAIVTASYQVMGYLQNVKDANKMRRLILDEVNSLWRLFLRLKEYTDSATGESADEPFNQTLKDLAQPDGDFAQTKKQLEYLKKQLVPSPTTSHIGTTISRLRWPFQEKEAERIVTRLQQLKSSITLAFQLSAHRVVRDIWEDLGHVKATLDEESFKKLLHWLTPISFTTKQEEILGRADPQRCRILGTKTFQSWHKADLRSLWYYGAPGAGKSVAAASIYDELSKQHHADNFIVIGAYCRHDDDPPKSPRNVIASFLKQTLQARGRGELPTLLKEHYSRADDKQIDLDTLLEVLRDELKSKDGAYIILDGLDEIGSDTDRVDMIKVIHDIGATVKVFMTARFSDDILEAVQATQVCIQCEDKHSNVYWRCVHCRSHVVCESCSQREPETCNAASTPQNEKKHETKRELRSRSLEYRPRESDIRDYVTRTLDSNSKLCRLLASKARPENLRQKAIDSVTENSGKMFVPKTHPKLLETTF